MAATMSRLLTRLNYLGRRLGGLRERLPPDRLLRVAVSRGLLRWLDPDLIPSYAQFGEDRVIDGFFGTRERGLYVDVGCNRPITYSNTWKLYLRGWHGIVIDANPALIAQYARLRPADTALAQVVSTATAPVEFYIPRASHLTAGIGVQVGGYWPRTAENSDIIRHQPVRLAELLRRHGMEPHFDLLSIDTEGNELDVLESLDLGEFTPTLIAVEIHDFEIAAPETSAVYLMLVQHGYRVIGSTGPTVFFALRGPHG